MPHAPLHLRRSDPCRNMARFYELDLQPTLFGECSLVRCWGRIGTAGRRRAETFVTPAQAQAALQLWARRKRRRDYVTVAACGSDIGGR